MIRTWLPSTDGVIAVLLLMSVVLNALFLYQPRVAARSRAQGLWAVGTVAPPLGVDSDNGERKWLEWEDRTRPMVLYVYSPKCRWCERNVGSLRSLVAQASGRFDVIGISVLRDEGRRTYLIDRGIPMPAFFFKSGAMQQGYRFGQTPQTIVVGAKGVVLANWVPYTSDIQLNIRSILGVTVPAVTIPK